MTNLIAPIAERINEPYGACDGVVAKALAEQTNDYIQIISNAALLTVTAAIIIAVLVAISFLFRRWLRRVRNNYRDSIIAELTGNPLSQVRRQYHDRSAVRAKERILADRDENWDRIEEDKPNGLGEK